MCDRLLFYFPQAREQASEQRSAPGMRKRWEEVGGGGGEGELEGREKASLTPAPYFSHPLAVSFFSRFACFFGNP